MEIPAIVQREDPVLRRAASPVLTTDIESPEIKEIIAKMFAALASQSDGVALAAPQIGIPLRIFVVSPTVFADADNTEVPAGAHLIYINPEIVKRSRATEIMDEGCLSIRGRYGKVSRASRVTVQAYDERGARFERGAAGLLAQIFQHETDHLDGILFTDKAGDVWDAEPPNPHEDEAAL